MFHRPTIQEARLVIQGRSLHRKKSHIQQKKTKNQKNKKTLRCHKGNEGSKSQGESLTRASKKFKMPFLRVHTSLQKLTHYCQAPVTIINCECNLINSNKLNPSLSIRVAKVMAGCRGQILKGALSSNSTPCLQVGALQMTCWNHHTSNRLLPGPWNEISHKAHSTSRIPREGKYLMALNSVNSSY